MKEKIFLIVCTVIAAVVVWFIRTRINRKRISPVIAVAIYLAEFVLFFIIAFLLLAGPEQIWFLNFPLAGLYMALFGDMASGIVLTICGFICKKSGQKPEHNTKSRFVKLVLSLLFSFLFTAYGMINMETVSADYHVCETAKVSESVRFAFLSDVHAGSAQSFGTLEKAVEQICSEKDLQFVVLGGDITDEYSSKEDMEKVYSLFGRIPVPVYFVYGNHDRQENAEFAHGRKYTQAEFENTLAENHVTILSDEFVEIGSEIVVLGREDASCKNRKPVEELVFKDMSKFNIVFDHQPHEHKDIIQSNADLQVSGHSHSAQFWPLQFFYNVFRYETQGEYCFGNTKKENL